MPLPRALAAAAAASVNEDAKRMQRVQRESETPGVKVSRHVSKVYWTRFNSYIKRLKLSCVLSILGQELPGCWKVQYKNEASFMSEIQSTGYARQLLSCEGSSTSAGFSSVELHSKK